MVIRKMKIKDVVQVVDLGKDMPESQFSEDDVFWSPATLKKWIKARDGILLVVEDKKKVIGFALSFFSRSTGVVELEDIFVVPKYRSAGVGTSLIQELIKIAKNRGGTYLYLLVKSNNKKAIHFYQKFFNEGFQFTVFSTEL